MIRTFSKFYYGISIDESNCKFDFDEGAGELTATLDTNTYTPTEIATELEQKLNLAGTFDYVVSFDRDTRKLTITSSSSVDFLFNSGTNAVEAAYGILGFDTTSDETGTSFEGDSEVGVEYAPQFILQSYIPVENMIEQLHSTVNETISGRQEIITYGDKSMMRCNIMFITDIPQPGGSPILNNASGVADAIDFLRWLSLKNKVEFIPDVAAPATFINLVLDSSPANKEGTTMRLREMYDRGLCEYYETEILTFRKVD